MTRLTMPKKTLKQKIHAESRHQMASNALTFTFHSSDLPASKNKSMETSQFMIRDIYKTLLVGGSFILFEFFLYL